MMASLRAALSFATIGAAAAAVSALKERGIIGFVAEEPRASGASSP